MEWLALIELNWLTTAGTVGALWGGESTGGVSEATKQIACEC